MGSDVIGQSGQARDLLSGRGRPLTWPACVSICSVVSDEWLLVLCQPSGRLRAMLTESGDPLGQHGAEKIDGSYFEVGIVYIHCPDTVRCMCLF